MIINPVLRNECKLAVRTMKFPLMVLAYFIILGGAGIFMYFASTDNALYEGLNLNTSIIIYISIAMVQAFLLMFMVPSMTSTVISSEREKQTLEVLLSSRMSSFNIIVGKLFASVSKVLILICLTLPVYGLSFLIGGVTFGNIIELSIFFIITTFFVGSIGVFFSTILKSSKAATATTYAVVLVLFLGVVIGAMGLFIYKISNNVDGTTVFFPEFIKISPVAGFISILATQVGVVNFTMGPLSAMYPIATMNDIETMKYFSMGLMVVVTILLVLYSSYKLNPLNDKKLFKRKVK